MGNYIYTKEMPSSVAGHFFCDVLRLEAEEMVKFAKHKIGDNSYVEYRIIDPNNRQSWELYPEETKVCSRLGVVRIEITAGIKFGKLPDDLIIF